jgi:hypothetical protein
VRESTESVLGDYYAALFGIDRRDLWRGVTARTHSERLAGYEGYYVASRPGGVHVSAPVSAEREVLHALDSAPVDVVQSPAFWEQFAARRSLRLIGPSTHSYLDVDPGPVEGVVRVNDGDLRSLLGSVDEAELAESGWNDEPTHAFGLYEDGVLVAASNLNAFHLQPRDVGVIVMPECRGRGYSVKAGRHAASIAIREHGFARWGARNSNLASLAAARKVGFEPWCSQLAVR